MARKILRNIDLYGMHGFLRDRTAESFPYEQFFGAFRDLSADQRVFEIKGRVVAFPSVRPFRRGFLVQAVEGPIGVKPIILDIQRGTARTEDLAETEVVTETTHFLVYASERRAAIEYNRRGAKAFQIGMAIEYIAGLHLNGFGHVDFSFAPIVSEEFTKRIDSLDRIRAVEFTVTKPNAGWTDHYNQLSDLLDKSNGEKADVGVRAPRGSSLAKLSGIVALVKEIAQDRQPYLLNAKVFGRPHSDTPEIVVPLYKHIVREKALVLTTDGGQVDSQELGSKMADLIENHSEYDAT